MHLDGKPLHLADKLFHVVSTHVHFAVDVAFVAFGAVFAVGAVVKTVVWWKSLGWALSNGHDYAQDVQKQAQSGSLTSHDRIRLIIRHKGTFWPCGPKSVLLIWRLRVSPTRQRRFLDLTFVKTPFFIAEGSVLALLASLVHGSVIARIVGTVLAAWICVYSLLLIIEAIVWYVIAKDYALVWGDLKFAAQHRGKSSQALGDFKGLGAVTLTAVLACSLLISVTAQSPGAYDKLPPSTFGVSTLVSSAYYVLITLTTVGDNSISPISVLARAAAGLLQVMVLLTAGFVLSAIAARLQDRP